MTDSTALGQKLHPFYQTHFEVLCKQDNKSNKYFMRCKYCPDEIKILHHDNRLLLHITDTTACSNAPSQARINGLQLLNGKLSGGKGKEASDTGEQESAKKRRLTSGKLESFFEKAILKETSDDYDRRLLRFVNPLLHVYHEAHATA